MVARTECLHDAETTLLQRTVCTISLGIWSLRRHYSSGSHPGRYIHVARTVAACRSRTRLLWRWVGMGSRMYFASLAEAFLEEIEDEAPGLSQNSTSWKLRRFHQPLHGRTFLLFLDFQFPSVRFRTKHVQKNRR